MRTTVLSGIGWSSWRHAPESEISSRFATARRDFPESSVHWTFTRSAQSMRVWKRLSCITTISTVEKRRFRRRARKNGLKRKIREVLKRQFLGAALIKREGTDKVRDDRNLLPSADRGGLLPIN